ncbi:MAG: J domain-containing protein [Acidimicrobiia bacterium]|nr:J domain-containing protein [Acidimicrobiia bacterium]MDH4362987.1 J domain-containing protein [Acidimicrobiia bacterium]MDH5289499.1 J domain-containing protein [Acidimicrobiia bacterium]
MDGRTAAAVLGITQGATRDEIRRAFRARAKIVHPDAHGTDQAFVTLRAAADLLLATASDRPERRAATPCGNRPAPVRSAPGLVIIAAGAEAAGPSAPAGGAAGRRRAARWVQQPAARPGAAIDLTDRPVGIRRPPGSPAAPETPAAAFARVLAAELARR